MDVLRFVIVFLALILPAVVRAELTDGMYATIDTSMGSFTCRLDYAEASLTCANFVGLVEGSQSWIDPATGAVRNDPFYDGLIFHRIIDGFMIQGGCPLGTGTSGPGYAFPDETSTNLTHHSAGILSMANSGPNSNGSQFFITLTPTPWLDAKHSVFGELVEGIGVVTNIGSVATTADRPDVDVVINQINILRIGAAAAAFDVSAQPLPEVTSLNLSLTHTPAGMQLVAGRTNQCEVAIFDSTNLLDWSQAIKKYWLTASNDWVLAVSPNQSAEFFRSTRVYYPQAAQGILADVTGKSLSFVNGTNSYSIVPLAGGVGNATINGVPDSVIYWSWSTASPYYGRLIYQLSSFEVYQFDVVQSDGAVGYRRIWDDELGWTWLSIGSWSFSHAPAP